MDKRDSICPLCGFHSRKLKFHCWQSHLPRMFRDSPRPELECQPIYQQLRGSALHQLAEWVLGRSATVFDLVRYVNQHTDILPTNVVMMDRCQRQMISLSLVMGWRAPRDDCFTLYPLNSPAVLMQWRVLVSLLARLSTERREEFRRFGEDTYSRIVAETQQSSNTSRPSSSPCQNNRLIPAGMEQAEEDWDYSGGVPEGKEQLTLPESSVPESQGVPGEESDTSSEGQFEDAEEPVYVVLDECTGDSPHKDVRRVVVGNLMEAFDSHCHLDRASILLQGDLGVTLEEWLSRPTGISPDPEVNVVGGVLVWCDPDFYPGRFPDAPWRAAIGFHPRHVAIFKPEIFDRIQELVANPAVCALGEIGVDRTMPMDTWHEQEAVVERLLTLSKPNQPVVLHIRGTVSDRNGETVYNRMLSILKMSCDIDQLLQLHCFYGSERMVQRWRMAFPNCHFSFTAKCKMFNAEQCRAVRAVPDHRLLIETDAPYFPHEGVRVNSPKFIGEIGSAIANIRNTSVDRILSTTLSNARKLFQ